MKHLFYLFLLFFLSVPFAKATHIVGGELYYKHLDSSRYEIRLSLYRDCFNGLVLFDSIAQIRIFNGNNTLVDTLGIPFTSSSRLDNVLPDPCIQLNATVCYEFTTYVDTIYLPPIAGGYQLAYKICCRNMTISNISFPLNTASVYYATIPELPSNEYNSSPVFNDLPPTFICAKKPFLFDHSAIDIDGDSLVYELFHPYNGSNQGQTHYPPYTRVNWRIPYSVNNMLGGDNPLSIDSSTGILTGIPDQTGQFVIGIKVSEYRKGVFLGETFRDYQFNVLSCEDVTVSSLLTPNFSCEDFTADFKNSSAGDISRYFWDFGDLTTDTDTSSQFEPSYTYSEVGTYQVSLIAYSNRDTKCNDTSYGTVTIKPEYIHEMIFTNDPCSKEVSFSSTNSLDSTSTILYEWDFGDNVGTSQFESPVHQYAECGSYDVELISYSTENKGCKDTTVVTIDILQDFTLSSAVSPQACSPKIIFSASIDLENVPFNYTWDFGDGTVTNEANTNHIYEEKGTYDILLRASTNNGCCIDSASYTFTKEDRTDPFIPNIFTPNQDGINDVLYAQGSIDGMELKIYNRWGRKVFESNNQSEGWDGKNNGELAEPGVYFYHFSIKCSGEEDDFQSGHITLIR